jgi:hypothetical protein
MSAVGGYTIYGTASQDFFQQSFSKQLDKNLSGGSPGWGDWLPFSGVGGGK